MDIFIKLHKIPSAPYYYNKKESGYESEVKTTTRSPIFIDRFWSESEAYRQSAVCLSQKVLPPRNDSDERRHSRPPIKMSILLFDESIFRNLSVRGYFGRTLFLYRADAMLFCLWHVYFNGRSNYPNNFIFYKSLMGEHPTRGQLLVLVDWHSKVIN